MFSFACVNCQVFKILPRIMQLFNYLRYKDANGPENSVVLKIVFLFEERNCSVKIYYNFRKIFSREKPVQTGVFCCDFLCDLGSGVYAFHNWCPSMRRSATMGSHAQGRRRMQLARCASHHWNQVWCGISCELISLVLRGFFSAGFPPSLKSTCLGSAGLQ